ncbi:MAG: hypothetical protein ABID38_00260 [Candidatus Diapherotrites archaeon]
MTNHDPRKSFLKATEVWKKIDPKFAELTLDLKDVLENSKDPVFVGAMLFKLSQERERTNKILEQINDNYDRIMFQLKTGETTVASETPVEKAVFNVLPEQDQIILKFVDDRGSVTATDVKSIMNYKGLNAASQRLNKLFKEGYLKKVQSGKRVLYLAKS